MCGWQQGRGGAAARHQPSLALRPAEAVRRPRLIEGRRSPAPGSVGRICTAVRPAGVPGAAP
ncbi:MAG: hypothetical protein O2865_07220 [Planctomycetota bacterium]|nr:hypothetical protein [Planctomycetota bacterium]MDA1220601.1 hypothetical protein [Planctomycetota bacterium]